MDYKVLSLADAEGSTLNYGHTVTRSGEVITCPPEFTNIKAIVDNLDRLELRDDDVILTSFSKAGKVIIENLIKKNYAKCYFLTYYYEHILQVSIN